ncbi:RNA 2',3'-cyclic phosphodiesterase [Thioalkalivibrio sp.]|uniref:RNA 2',3'-cyclic phosphodiesterase n=1 Tax=Thioalkalivibrio sp. TaxID=2093813 RepID=UPI003975F82E
MPSETNLQRVFFALWPDDRLRSRLAAVARGMTANGRLVPAGHLHLTLAFPGTVSTEVVATLISRAAAIAGPPIPLRLDRVGYFPRSRVAWVGPSEVPLELEALAAWLQGIGRDCGLRMEDRPFRPHVTLRRFVSHFEAVPIDPLDWFADRVVLIESGQGGHPGAYRLLRSWLLEGPPMTVPEAT